MRIILVIITVIHGIIHLAGWARAYGFGGEKILHNNIPKAVGSAWFAAFILFFVAAVGLLTRREWWLLAMILAAVLSQVLIASVWKEAMWGTVANILIVACAIFISTRTNNG